MALEQDPHTALGLRCPSSQRPHSVFNCVTRFAHTAVCGHSPTSCPSTRHSKNVHRWKSTLTVPGTPTLSHPHTHSWLPSLPQSRGFKHTLALSPAEVSDVTQGKKGLATVRDGCCGGGGGGVLPTHTGLDLPPILSWEVALAYLLSEARPWGHWSWGGTKECSWHVLTGDFIAGQTQEGLGGSGRVHSHWVQETALAAPRCD